MRMFFNFITGLMSLIFALAVKLFFIVTSLMSMIFMGICFVQLLISIHSSNLVNIKNFGVAIIGCMCYLAFTYICQVGFHSILSFCSVVAKSLVEAKKKVDRPKEPVGKNGVFKNE